MIRENEYLEALNIVNNYKKQQELKIKRNEEGDICLLDVLSNRSKNALIMHNESKWTRENEKLIYVSDVVRFIKKDGYTYKGKGEHKGVIYYSIIKLRNLGHKSHQEIMKYVKDYL